jgi:hypothetical protein
MSQEVRLERLSKYKTVVYIAGKTLLPETTNTHRERVRDIFCYSIIKSFSVQYTLLMSESSLQSNTAKMGTIINMLTLLIKIGKYLLWMVLGFALLNLTLAILDFTVWNNVAVGVFNSILAFGGFVFFGQLSKRRTIHRYEYGFTTRHLSRLKKIEE